LENAVFKGAPFFVKKIIFLIKFQHSPMLSPVVNPGPYGITPYPNKEKTKVITGPKKNNMMLA